MSNIDFENGLVVGLLLGNHRVTTGRYIDVDFTITNEDTHSLIIDFKVPIPDLNFSDYINALFINANYGADQIVIPILGWERINSTTIKFLTADYFSSNGILYINYNDQYGNIGALNSFTVTYQPEGLPIVIYARDTFPVPFAQYLLSLIVGLDESTSETIIYEPEVDSISEEFEPIAITGVNFGSIQLDGALTDASSADLYEITEEGEILI